MNSAHFPKHSLSPQLMGILFFAFLNSLLFPQSDTIVKICDNGMYITSLGDTIVPYAISVPSIAESTKYGTEIVNEINEWVNDYLIGQDFTILIEDTLSQHLYSAKIFRERFTGQQDYAELLVDMGFATVDSSLNNKYSNSLKQTQSLAIKNKKGIWRIFKPSAIVNNSQPTARHYSESGFGLKFASLATLALSTVLTWDYATQVSDLTKAIDDSKQIVDYDTGPLERERTRKIIYTAVCGITAVISFYLAIDSFEIKTTNNSVNFLYKF